MPDVPSPARGSAARKMYACAAMANASVLTASSSPRTRSAPKPDRDRDGARDDRAEQQRPAERDARERAADEQRRAPADVEREVRPRTNAAALSAPMPANAIWPSDSCPPQPVSTVTDTAHTANARTMA